MSFGGTKKSGGAMDEERRQRAAYEYLCHIEEMRQWMAEVLEEDDLGDAHTLENHMRNGVLLARVAMKFQQDGKIKEKKIYDITEAVYNDVGLKFRHTDNIIQFIQAMERVGMPPVFFYETSDLFDKKNLPRVIYCIHALAHFLFKKGFLDVRIKDLLDEVEFTEEQISAVDAELNRLGVKMPVFGKVGGVLAAELSEDVVAMHAAVMAINEAVETRDANTTHLALLRDAAGIVAVADKEGDAAVEVYQYCLWNDLKAKQEAAAAAGEAKAAESAAADEAKAAEAAEEEEEEAARKKEEQEMTPEEKSLARSNSSASGIFSKKTIRKDKKVVEEEVPDNDVYETILTKEQIQKSIENANAVVVLNRLNEAVANDDADTMLECLKHDALHMKRVDAELKDQYMADLRAKLQDKGGLEEVNADEEVGASGVVAGRIPALIKAVGADSAEAYANEQIIAAPEITGVVSQVHEREDRWAELKANEANIVKIQAMMRRKQAQKAVAQRKQEIADAEAARLQYLADNTPAALTIQSHFRAMKARQEVARRRAAKKDRDDFLDSNLDTIIKLQSWWRMRKQRTIFVAEQKHFTDNLASIIRIQAKWKSFTESRLYATLISEHPTPRAVRRFLYLLDNAHIDFADELLLQRLRMKVVNDIRENQEVETSLAAMDVKIGLLISNRMSVDMIEDIEKKNKKKGEGEGESEEKSQGLKGLNADSVKRLESYQNLFYLLQTEPQYLAKLLLQITPAKSNKFLEYLIFPLFSYAQNEREEYLLLKLFQTTMGEEIDIIDEPSEFVKSDPTIIKMAVNFNRKGPAEAKFLRTLLAPLVEELINSKETELRVEPSEIWAKIITTVEENTGVKSTDDYNVTNHTAMEDTNVKKFVNMRMENIKKFAQKFMDRIFNMKDDFPYGIRYITMQLRLILEEKFPDQEDEIVKVLGNLVYYRYINPAIVMPEQNYFDILDLTPDQINAGRKKNLAALASLITKCTLGKKFDADGEDTFFMTPLNPFVDSAFAQWKKFLIELSTVEEPEKHFGIDTYTEATRIQNSTVWLSQKELLKTHGYLIEHAKELYNADEGDQDKLKVILDSMDKPLDPETVEDTAIELKLKDKFTVEDDGDADMSALNTKAKQSLVALFRGVKDGSVMDVLTAEITDDMEAKHTAFLASQESGMGADRRSIVQTDDDAGNVTSLAGSTLKSLQETLKGALAVLEKAEWVTAPEYVELTKAVAKDIRSQAVRRQRRQAELKKMNKTLASLETKKATLDERRQSHSEYISMCMQNMQKKAPVKKSLFGRKGGSHAVKDGTSSQGTYKYNAKELFEKGVLVELEGVPKSLRSKVSVVMASDETGVYKLTAKIPVVGEFSEEIRLDDMLEMQFEGKFTMKMFDDNATLNINLFKNIINKKFNQAQVEEEAPKKKK